MRKFLCLSIFTTLLSTSALAQTPTPQVDYNLIPAPIVKILVGGNGRYKENFMVAVLRPLREQGRSMTSIDQKDIDSQIQETQNDLRRRQIQQYLAYDLNFDGNVTEAEVAERTDKQFNAANRSSYPQNASRAEQMKNDAIGKLKSLDADNDGNVSVQEMGVLLKNERENSRPTPGGTMQELLLLDPDKDGVLTVAELTAIAEKIFNSVDLDKDGQLSPEELVPLREKADQDRRNVVNIGTKCVALPKANAEDKIIYMGAYDGKSLSSVTVAGQMEDTDVIPVVIEEGEGKLYIILSSQSSPIIWKLSGATSRISTVVAAGAPYKDPEQPNKTDGLKIKAGVMGVDKANIAFVDSRACGLAGDQRTRNGDHSRIGAVIERLLGRKHAMALDEYSILSANIGTEITSLSASSKVVAIPDGFDKTEWERHISTMPGGVVNIQKDLVVSDVPAEDYEVLPKWAGLSKLIASGALVRTDQGFKIVKPIPYFPSGLTGAYASHFLLGTGVPMPKGIPGHSCVQSEETGKVLVFGGRCGGMPGSRPGVTIDSGAGRDLMIINR